MRSLTPIRWQVVAAWSFFAAGCVGGVWSNLARPHVDLSAVSDRLAGPMLPWYEVFAINAGVALQLGTGFFSAGVLSAYWTTLFGFDIASTIAALVRAGTPGPVLAAAFLPHGVVEVPALVAAGAAGLGGAAVAMHAARGERAAARARARQSVNLITVAFALLLLAAALEVWVTPWVLRRVL